MSIMSERHLRIQVAVCEQFAHAAHEALEAGLTDLHLLAAFDAANGAAEPHHTALLDAMDPGVREIMQGRCRAGIRRAAMAGFEDEAIVDLFDEYCRASNFVDQLAEARVTA